ncbi:MAG: pyridoxal phosphate-dependent decarboxylase family protein [Actinomycetota bacterium]
MIPLDPSPAEMRALGEAALGYAIDFLGSRPDALAAGEEGGLEAARRHRGAPPETGRSFDDLLALVDEVQRHANDNAGPGFMAYIPGGGLYASSLADLLALTINRYVSLWSESAVGAQIEDNVVRWLCGLVGFGDAARGTLTTGGSLANLAAVVTARRARLGESFLDGTIYVSDQAHRSVEKAARIAGIPSANLRVVPTDAALRIDVDALAAAIAADRAAGRRPFMVSASAGTTNTGAIDPLPAIADVATREGLWFHVDAAYGGFFLLTERGRDAFAGIERADSVTLDPHKGMFLPYGTGAIVVRDGSLLRDAHHAGVAAYLQDLEGEGELPNFSEYSSELSRDFRGLRVWFPLWLHGVGAFRSALDEKLDLARWFHGALGEVAGIELPWEPELSIVPFRLRDRDDDANRAFLGRINASQRVFLSSTVLQGRYTLRAAILSHRTHRDRVEECLDIVRRAARA